MMVMGIQHLPTLPWRVRKDSGSPAGQGLISITGSSRTTYAASNEITFLGSDGSDFEVRIKRDTDINTSTVTASKIETAFALFGYSDGDGGEDYKLVETRTQSDFTNKTQSSRKNQHASCKSSNKSVQKSLTAGTSRRARFCIGSLMLSFPTF